MHNFSPSCGIRKTIAEAYESNAPTLTYLDICYGEGSAVMWLVMWISSVFASCGFVSGQVTDLMKVGVANAIRQEFYFLNINELAAFFTQFVAGKYEVFYGNPNPQVITKSLCSFVKSRKLAVEEVEKARATEKRNKELHSGNAVTFDEWVRMMKANGEEVHLEVARTKDGGFSYRQNRDEKLVAAEMIVRNTSGCGKQALNQLRELFLKKYGEDPYDYYERKKNNIR